MRVVFLGTPEFAVPSLKALCEKHEVAAVVCQPDRERDRKGNFVQGAVKRTAIELGLPVYQFEKIKLEGVETLRELKPDVMITCAYGQILSQEILDIPQLGVLNVHGSLLPAYRGSAPIQRALINGESKTGVTIMKTDVGMDSGAMLAKAEVDIEDGDYVSDLYDKLSALGAELLMKTLDDYAAGKIAPQPQNENEVTYAPPLRKEEAYIDFNASAATMRNILRGFGYAVCSYNGEQLKIYGAELVGDNVGATPGTILTARKKELTVACGQGALRLTELQLSGKKRMKTVDFLNGVKMQEGEMLKSIN